MHLMTFFKGLPLPVVWTRAANVYGPRPAAVPHHSAGTAVRTLRKQAAIARRWPFDPLVHSHRRRCRGHLPRRGRRHTRRQLSHFDRRDDFDPRPDRSDLRDDGRAFRRSGRTVGGPVGKGSGLSARQPARSAPSLVGATLFHSNKGCAKRWVGSTPTWQHCSPCRRTIS